MAVVYRLKLVCPIIIITAAPAAAAAVDIGRDIHICRGALWLAGNHDRSAAQNIRVYKMNQGEY